MSTIGARDRGSCGVCLSVNCARSFRETRRASFASIVEAVVAAFVHPSCCAARLTAFTK